MCGRSLQVRLNVKKCTDVFSVGPGIFLKDGCKTYMQIKNPEKIFIINY